MGNFPTKNILPAAYKLDLRTEVTMSKEASQERICLNGPRKRQGGSSGSKKRLIWEYSFLEKKKLQTSEWLKEAEDETRNVNLSQIIKGL